MDVNLKEITETCFFAEHVALHRCVPCNRRIIFLLSPTRFTSLVIVIIGAILAIANALSDGKEPNVRKLLTTVGVTLAFAGAIIANKDT
jgi:hypothetical protein